MVANMTLDEEQLAFLLEHHEVIDALFDFAETEEFRAKFGNISIDEVLKRYIATIGDDNDAWEHDIGERYRNYQQQKDEPGFIIDDDDDFAKLEAKYRK